MDGIDVMNNYAMDHLKKALKKVQYVMNPQNSACRCKNCLFETVATVNYWIDFCEHLMPNGPLGHYYVIDHNGESLSIVFVPIDQEWKLS